MADLEIQKRGFSAPEIFFGCNAHFRYVKSELHLEATLGLVKRLGISKGLIRECVTVPGCCCMIIDGLVQLCSQ